MAIVVKYDEHILGVVVTNRSLIIDEVIELTGLDLSGPDPWGGDWDMGLFDFDDCESDEIDGILAEAETNLKKAAEGAKA